MLVRVLDKIFVGCLDLAPDAAQLLRRVGRRNDQVGPLMHQRHIVNHADDRVGADLERHRRVVAHAINQRLALFDHMLDIQGLHANRAVAARQLGGHENVVIAIEAGRHIDALEISRIGRMLNARAGGSVRQCLERLLRVLQVRAGDGADFVKGGGLDARCQPFPVIQLAANLNLLKSHWVVAP